MIQKDHSKYEREYQGKSLRMIAKETKHDFRTVKKYADLCDWNEPIPKKRRGRPTVLDPVKSIIDHWLTGDLLIPRKQRHTAQRIYTRLKKRIPGSLPCQCPYRPILGCSKEKRTLFSKRRRLSSPYPPPG